MRHRADSILMPPKRAPWLMILDILRFPYRHPFISTKGRRGAGGRAKT